MASWVGFFLVSSFFCQLSFATQPWATGVSSRHLRGDTPILPSSQECRADSVVLRAAAEPSKAFDITNAFNRLIARFGIHNVTGNRPLVSYVGDPAYNTRKELAILKGNRKFVFTQEEIRSYPVDIGKAFSDLGGNINCQELTRHDQKVVDFAAYRTLSFPGTFKDITMAVNALLKRNGHQNVTGGLSMNDITGDPAPGEPKLLQVVRGPWTLEIWENFCYDLSPLFEDGWYGKVEPLEPVEDTRLEAGWLKSHSQGKNEPVKVDFADYRSVRQPSKYIEVTEKINDAIAVNGLAEMNRNLPLWEMVGDPAPGQDKMLRVCKGYHILDIPYQEVYNLAPLFISPAIRSKGPTAVKVADNSTSIS